MVSALTILDLDHLTRTLTELLQGKVDEISPMPRRSQRLTFTARLHRPEGITPILIRFFQGLRSVDELRNESYALRDLSRLGYPVPLSFMAVESPAVAGAPFSVIERLPGEPVAHLAVKSPERFSEWMDHACSMLLKLHSLPYQKSFDWIQPGLMPLDYAERQVKVYARHAENSKVDDAMPGFQWLRANMYLAKRASRVCLVHRDYHPHNVIANEKRIVGVVDWGDLAIADPAVDLGWTHMILETEGGSGLGNAFVENYLRRVPEVRTSLVFWEVFAACKRLIMLADPEKSGTSTPTDFAQVHAAVKAFMEQRLSAEDL